MGKAYSFETKMEALNLFIENVENWIFKFDDKWYFPPGFNEDQRTFGVKHENVIIFAFVLFKGVGTVYKVVKVASDKYKLTEIPQDIHKHILESFFTTGPTDILNPNFFLQDAETEMPKFTYEARWQPPDDYVKQLVEKRNFLLNNSDFLRIKEKIKIIHEKSGVKTPNYIDKKPFVQIPDEIVE